MFFRNFHTIRLIAVSCAILVLSGLGGCGTSKLTNTTRTATEQLLISNAMDRAVSQVNFSVLREKHVFINVKPIEKITDAPYLESLIRQHALACGCLLEEKEEDAEIIMELRAGTSGTDQNDTLFGISAMTLPGFGTFNATTIPEVALAKKSVQSATVKIGIFAYTREGHRPIWQSGNLQAESKAKNRWLLGMGPYQTGDIYEKSTFNGQEVSIPLITTNGSPEEQDFIPVGSQAFFRQNLELEAKEQAEAEAKKKKEEEEKAAAEAQAKTDETKKDEESKSAEVAAAPAAAPVAVPPSFPVLAPAPVAVPAQPAMAVGSDANLLVPAPVSNE